MNNIYFENVNVILGITGSIAVYKACELVREFIKRGAVVNVVMTKNACEFVTPLTFQTLSKNHVTLSLFDQIGDWKPEHISLAERSDVFVVAPASANVIENIEKLKSRGVVFVEPEEGELACGTSGIGRLASINKIIENCKVEK